MQTSPIKVDWSVLPVSIIALAALVYMGVWAADKLGITRKPKTFAEEGELFWDKLRMVIREEIDASHNKDNRT